MAQWKEIAATELFNRGSHIIFDGFTGTQTAFEKLTDTTGRITKTNAQGRRMWQLTVVNGNHVYRITVNGIRKLPLINNDHEYERRLARILGWPLTWILYLAEGEAFKYSQRCQEDNGICTLPARKNIRIVRVQTTDNPEWVRRIIVRKGSKPSWEETSRALRIYAQNDQTLPTFEEAVERAKLVRVA